MTFRPILVVIFTMLAVPAFSETLTLDGETAQCLVSNGSNYIFKERSLVVFTPTACPEDQSITAGIAAIAQNSGSPGVMKRYFVTVSAFNCFLENISTAILEGDSGDPVTIELGCTK